MTYVVKHCLFCKTQEKLKSLYRQTFNDSDLSPQVFSARRATEHYHYHMVKCEGCSLVFSREVLSDEDLLPLYAKSTVTFSSYAPVLRRDYWAPLRPYTKRLREASVLEIGCSSGFFLEELRAQGIQDVTGFEPSLEAKTHASAAIQPLIVSSFFKGKESVGDRRFNLVCSFHTLDHMSEPLETVKLCRQVLKPGGLLYLVVHNANALQAKILGEKSPIIDIEHIYLFNKQTLRRLLQDDFHVLECGNLKNSYPLRYWLHMLPLPLWIKSWLEKALTLFRLIDYSPAFAAGNIFAIAECLE